MFRYIICMCLILIFFINFVSSKIIRMQKSFTSKIYGLEEMNNHNRLKKLGIYSLKRRRERFLKINVRLQLEVIKENAQNLETGRRSCIKSVAIPTTLDGKYRTLIQNSTVREMRSIYHIILMNCKKMKDVNVDTFFVIIIIKIDKRFGHRY